MKQNSPLFSQRGKKVLAGGIAVAVVGFFVLTFTDPQGQNWASQLSPFLLVSGYGLMGFGLVLRDPVLASDSSSPVLSSPSRRKNKSNNPK